MGDRIYIIDLSAMYARRLEASEYSVWPIEPLHDEMWSLRAGRDRMVHQMLYEMRVGLAVGGVRYVDERDPFWDRYEAGHAWEWFKSAVGYDWRKLRGRLRKVAVPVGNGNPRAHAVIKNVVG